MKLVVFDLDQTLVEVLPIHDESAADVFEKYFGVRARLSEVDYAGRTLSENFLEIARTKGIPAETIIGKGAEILEYYNERFVARFPSGGGSRFVLPGAGNLLEGLSRAGHVLALYTGDSRRVAEAILRGTGLDSYFKLRFFGTEARKRSDMIRDAISSAESLAGRRFSGGDVVVIGDSVRDVEAAREVGARVIAVATGFHSPDDLEKAGADHVFPDLADGAEVLAAIEGRRLPPGR